MQVQLPEKYDVKKLIVAIDFDGTIIKKSWPYCDNIYEECIDIINGLVEEGHIVIIWTCRKGASLQMAKEFLDANGVKYHLMNKHYPDDSRSPRKVYADLYLDDKAQISVDNKYNWDMAKKLIAISKQKKLKTYKLSNEEFYCIIEKEIDNGNININSDLKETYLKETKDILNI